MPDRMSREKYRSAFVRRAKPADSQKEALKHALDIRKFEIDLYWRRAAYFWTFIAATFGAYFLLQKDANAASFDSTYIVTCLGFMFSVAWYLVNRGSKAWQRNWEMHVDLLEDEITGPLYKTTLNRRTYNFWEVTSPYPFSPSNINLILGLIVIGVWLFLILRTIATGNWTSGPQIWTFAIMTALTVMGIALLLTKGGSQETDGVISIHPRTRKYSK